MPPVNPPQDTTPHISAMPQTQSAPRKKGGAGATVGIIIIVLLMLLGGLYFWGAHLNAQKSVQELPLIPADSSAQ